MPIGTTMALIEPTRAACSWARSHPLLIALRKLSRCW
jgi:hypothetical protein